VKINIKIIPNAKRNKVIEETDKLKVYVTALAVDGKANKALIELIADYFHVAKSNVKIIKGEKSRNKMLAID
jgi:uncharacterized protein (TIGR00251 family)